MKYLITFIIVALLTLPFILIFLSERRFSAAILTNEELEEKRVKYKKLNISFKIFPHALLVLFIWPATEIVNRYQTRMPYWILLIVFLIFSGISSPIGAIYRQIKSELEYRNSKISSGA